jgi:lipopolysaccharide biosynthesis regulator YciM
MVRLKRGETRECRTLAALLTQQGKVAWAAGQPRHGAAHLRSALALDPECIEAALYLGRILLRQGKLSQAFRIWEALAKTRPEFLFLAFRDMQTAFRQSKGEAAWESFLQTFTRQHANDPTGYLALAECYEARGQVEEAKGYLHQVLELDPLCREAHLALLSVFRLQGLPSEALDSYERLAQQTVPRAGGRFRCRACGHAREEPFWRCPACHLWATPERLLLPSSVVPLAAEPIAPALSRGSTAVSTAPIAVTRDVPPQPRPEA